MDHSNDYTKLFDLTGKVCIVTGGTGHLGMHFVSALYSHGASVAVADILDRENHLLSGKAEQANDVSSSDSIRKCFRSVAGHFGRIDVLVNCAVYCEGSQIEFMSDEVFANGVDGCVVTVFRATREIIPFMKEKGGSIINIASMYGVVSPDPRIYGDNPQKNPPNYGAGKAGVLQLTRHSGAHLVEYGIRVNAIIPGPFPTPANQSDPVFFGKLCAKVMMERPGHPSELEGACVFLASEASSYMTGSNITIDGGWTAW